jgi:hypothetical protein
MDEVSAPKEQPTSAPAPRRPGRWPRRLALLSWLGWAAAVFSLWLQFHLGVYHTQVWLWLPAALLGVAAGAGAFLFGSWRGVFGPRRWAGLGWALLGAAPLLLWAALVVYMFHEQDEKYLPSDDAHKVGRLAAINLLEGHAWLRYPHRLETERLVMYYADGVSDPAGDAAAMDVHLARLEEILGRRQHSKITWVRGSALGLHGMSIHSVALASDASPASWVDRHELAHAFLYQFSRPDSEPPMLLLEGWAMAVDGHPEPLQMTALACRGKAETCLGRILGPEDYHRGTGDAYYVGGALVDYLLRRYGGERFLEFYNACRPGSYETDFERLYGVSFGDMERDFWRDAEGAGDAHP